MWNQNQIKWKQIHDTWFPLSDASTLHTCAAMCARQLISEQWKLSRGRLHNHTGLWRAIDGSHQRTISNARVQNSLSSTGRALDFVNGTQSRVTEQRQWTTKWKQTCNKTRLGCIIVLKGVGLYKWPTFVCVRVHMRKRTNLLLVLFVYFHLLSLHCIC